MAKHWLVRSRIRSGFQLLLNEETRELKQNHFRGVLWMLLSAIMFSLQLSILKYASLAIHPLEVVTLRNTMALIPLAVLAAWNRPTLPVQLNLFLLRSLLGVATAAAMYSSTALSPLAVITLIFNARIFPLSVIANIVLGEHVSRRRLLLITAGFSGIAVTLLPRIENYSVEFGVVLAGAAALLSAGSQLCVKALTNRNSALTVSLYGQIGLCLLSIPLSISVWTTPTLVELSIVATAASFGGVASLAATHAFKSAPATVVSPVDNTAVAFSALLGFLLFNEVPSWYLAFGAVVVFLSSYCIARYT